MMTIVSLLLSLAFASTSEMSYEGVLTDVAGSPVTTSTSMSVRITDGSACVVHTQSFPSVMPDSSGFFTLKMTGLTKAMFELPGSCAGTSRYFELTVDGETFPLIEMDSTPYSMIAGKAQEATSLVGPMGGSTTGQVLTWNQSTQTWSAQAATAGTETDPTVSAWAKNPSLAAADVPALDTTKITTGTLPVNRGGTGAMSFAAGQVIVANGGGSSLQSLNCTNGQVIKYDASNQAVCGADDSGGSPTGSAGGVLTGTYPSPSLSTGAISLVNFSSMGLTPAEAGRVIKWDGTAWITAADATGVSGGVANSLPKYDSATSMIPSIIQDDGAGNINFANASPKIRFNGTNVLHATGTENIGLGLAALNPSVSGTSNTAIGGSALDVVTSGAANTAVGAHSLGSNVSGVENTAMGASAVIALTNGSYNVGIGNSALGSTANGQGNTALGYRAGYNINGVSNSNIFIGRNAGPTSFTTISNRLYINNSASDTPLIGGNFGTSAVDINGSMNIDFAGGYLNYQPNGNACNAGDTLSWDNVNLRWVCGPASSGGDITSVTAGTGLSGGNTSGDATLSVNYGITANTAAEGNDPRLSDARTPAGAAGGSLSGTYPNPNLATGAVSYGHLNSSGGPTNDGLILKDASGHLFDKACTANQVLNWTVATGWDCVNPSALVGVGLTTISGGTQNYLSKFNLAGDNVVNSVIYDNGINVGVGTNSPSSKLEVVSNPNVAAAYTGRFTLVPQYTGSGTSAAVMAVNDRSVDPGANNSYGSFSLVNYSASAAATGYVFGSRNEASLTSGGGTAIGGAYNRVSNTSLSVTNAYGSLNEVTTNGTVANAYGVKATVSGGATTSAYGVAAQVSSGSYSTAYGILADVNNTTGTSYGIRTSVSGSSTAAFGLYIDSIVGSSNFGIYQADTSNPNFFAAPLRLGSSVAPTPTTWINIVGAINPEIKISDSASVKGRIGFATSASQIISGSLASSLIFGNTAGAVHLGTSSGVQVTVSGASVGIGTTAPGYKLDINGDTNIAAANVLRFGGTQVCASAGCTAASDVRLKENIQPLENSLEKILSLRAVEYDYKDKQKFTDRHQIGVIAQEVEQVYPEVVITDKTTGLKSVAYDHLVAPLIEAVKTVYRDLASVDERVEKLEAENASLKAYLCSKDPSAPICH